MGQMLGCHWDPMLLARQGAAYAMLLLTIKNPHTALTPTMIAALPAMARVGNTSLRADMHSQ